MEKLCTFFKALPQKDGYARLLCELFNNYCSLFAQHLGSHTLHFVFIFFLINMP